METRASNILARGTDYFDDILSNREEETLHLEFKTLSNEGGYLKRDDRKMLAAALVGLANAEGGVVIIGIETKTVDGVDVAAAKRPVKSLQRTLNLIRSAIPEMLSPQHLGISAFSVPERDRVDEGFIAIDVPVSSDRPHYSNVHHQYFRRGSYGTRVLEHGEVRDLMLALRQGSLEIDCNLQVGASSGDLKFRIDLFLTIQNIGQVPVSAPYVRILETNTIWDAVPSTRNMSVRHLDGRWGFYSGRDILVHVEDEISLTRAETGLNFRSTGQVDINEALRKIREGNLWHACQMAPLSSMLSSQSDYPISVRGIFGGENALAKTFEFNLNKRALVEQFSKKLVPTV
ncbi:ATP-binding protein [Bradyrhizobium sp. SZCCHNS3004]|uniref:AlbA family DNA-binding domain-containing protein n=1 Tax=Bradyrhizobium sp. SZCCHNS3004 TaxID=3057312 RepID=UPI0029166371|nr:ATP-binding protein [Bradyrhizobium sp. SZCCHNS3004]